MRGFFLFFSRFQAPNQLLLLFSNNNNSRRTSQRIVRPQTRFWFSSSNGTASHVQGRALHSISLESETTKNQEQQTETLSSSTLIKRRNQRNLSAMTKISNPDGQLLEKVKYLLDFGFSHDQIKDIVRRYPSFTHLTLNGKIKPLIKFLVELGVPDSGVLRIIFRQPQLCGLSISQNILPTMTYLESFGINKRQLAKAISRFPPLLAYSIQKLKASIEFFAELGLSEEAIGKTIARYPSIVGYNVEDRLRPTSLYFESLGISPRMLIQQAPAALVQSVEAKLKPLMNFFLDKGFNIDEVILMISRFGHLCYFSLVANIQPKWEFFITMPMGYANSELVKFPQYFSYSLEGRIKPRFSRMASSGIQAPLATVLSSTDPKFKELIRRKLEKAGCLS